MDSSSPAPGAPSDPPPPVPAPTPAPAEGVSANEANALPPPANEARPSATAATPPVGPEIAPAAPGPVEPVPAEAQAEPPVLAAPAEPAAPPPLPEIPPPPPPEYPQRVPIAFHGEAKEYFRIWIVNTLLALLTLGVFAAWGKVRKRRYLRGNAEVLGHRFDYTAEPWRLLIGNIIVVAFFLAYGLFGAVYPLLRGLAFLIGAGLLPWVVVRSLAFNAHHTVWRGLRFRFHPSLSAAVVVYLLKPILIGLSLGFYYPAWVRARDEFRIARHRLGTAYFEYETRTGQYYGPFFAAGGIVLGGFIAMAMILGTFAAATAGQAPRSPMYLMVPMVLTYLTLFYLAKHFLFATIFNRMWNGTRLNEHRFHANMQTGRWIGMQFVNLGAVVVSCGLLYPWAVIRSTRYALSCLELELQEPVDKIARLGSNVGSAVGDTAAEFAGLDFGL